jgi:SMODS-associated and fused to various effectors sensor domain
VTHDPSFFTDEAQGGIRGDRGFTAQTVVLLHRLPALFDNSDFEGVVYEGQEDFDIHFQRSAGKRLYVVQCKAKPLSNPEIREILDGMYARYLSAPDLYEQFEIVAQAFPPRVEAVRLGGFTVKQAQNGYMGTPTDIKTASDYSELIQSMLIELKCSSDITLEWIRRYLILSSKMPSFPFVEREVVDSFASECTDCRQFGVQILAPFRFAAAVIQQKLKLHLRDLITRQELVKIVHDACISYRDKVQREGVKIHIDHWRDKDGKAIISADQVFEWRPYYEAARPSGIPSNEITQQLLKEIQEFERKNMNVWKEADVHLLSPCSLSAAIIVGHTYMKNKGYTLSVTAHDGVWRFERDMAPSSEVELCVLDDVSGTIGQSAIFALGVGRNIAKAVKGFVAEENLHGRLLVFQTSLDHLNELQARRVAADVIKRLRDLDSDGVKEINLFFSGPMALAAMIGSQLNKVGQINIFELDYELKYRLAFSLKT